MRQIGVNIGNFNLFSSFDTNIRIYLKFLCLRIIWKHLLGIFFLTKYVIITSIIIVIHCYFLWLKFFLFFFRCLNLEMLVNGSRNVYLRAIWLFYRGFILANTYVDDEKLALLLQFFAFLGWQQELQSRFEVSNSLDYFHYINFLVHLVSSFLDASFVASRHAFSRPFTANN